VVALMAHIGEEEPQPSKKRRKRNEAEEGDEEDEEDEEDDTASGDGAAGKQWTALMVTTVIKAFFLKKFGIELSQTSPRNENPPGLPLVRSRKPRGGKGRAQGEQQERDAAVTHVCRLGHERSGSSRCRELRPSQSAARCFFRLMQAYAARNEKSAATVLEELCERIQAPVLPGVAPEAEEETPAANDNGGSDTGSDSGGYGAYNGYGAFISPVASPDAAAEDQEEADDGEVGATQTTEFETFCEDRERRADEKRTRSKKRKEEAEKEAKAWGAVIEEFVPTEGYSAQVNRFVCMLLSAGMKVRTKRSMRRAVLSYKSKIKKLDER
jgi:hypothetical protein